MSNLSDSIIPPLRGPVEEIALQILERRGIPSRADFREFRTSVDEADTAVRRVEKQVNEVRGGLSRLLGHVSDAEAAIRLCQAEADAAHGALTRASQPAEALHGVPPTPGSGAGAGVAVRAPATRKALGRIRAAVAAAEPESTTAAGRRGPRPNETGCVVPGCNSPYRSKGFCGRHYQAWRRGALAELGFPAPDLE